MHAHYVLFDVVSGYHSLCTCTFLSFFQLTECCVNVLVGSFKETILAECPGMIAANETESESIVYKFKRIIFISANCLEQNCKNCHLALSIKIMGFSKFWAGLEIV